MIFGKLFRTLFVQHRKLPELAPRSFDEAPGAALEYALWMRRDGRSGIFAPVVISFSGVGTEQACTLVSRDIAPPCNGNTVDIGESPAHAEATLAGLPKGDWEIFLHEGRARRDDGFLQNCFIGRARNNLTGEEFSFLRPFQFDGERNIWAGGIRRISCSRNGEEAERLPAAPSFRP